MVEGEKNNYLGIDWGKVKIGLAIADDETRIAFAFDILKKEKNPIEKIIEIIESEKVKEVVIGVPSYINREETVYEGEKVGKIIEARTNIPVNYQNEMFTTKMAQANLIQKGVKGIGRQDDQEAARIILQEWLDLNIKK